MYEENYDHDPNYEKKSFLWNQGWTDHFWLRIVSSEILGFFSLKVPKAKNCLIFQLPCIEFYEKNIL